MKGPRRNGGQVAKSNFSRGFQVHKVELVDQRKHYGDHLERTTTEHQFRDTKTAKSRRLAQYLNCVDPINKPKVSLDEPTRRHYKVNYIFLTTLYSVYTKSKIKLNRGPTTGQVLY